VRTITAKYSQQNTKAVLDLLAQGDSLLLTLHGRTVARMEPVAADKLPGWKVIMAEVWRAQKHIKSSERTANPVLQERQRRRR
jgi:antitoxin (DNA-binding transcriptional repressor) of toxin-antitoxin stability system